jgi:hypothetical protein
LSSGFGGRSNTRRYISEPITRCPRPHRPIPRLLQQQKNIRVLTGRHPIRPTSPRCRMSRRLNPGRRSTYQTEEAVQTSGASSDIVFLLASFAIAWIKASVFEKHAEPQPPYARHRRCIGRAHYRFLVA